MTKLPDVVRAVWLVLLLFPLSAPARDRAGADHLPLPVLDLERYAGAWNHLAWLPEDFQRRCARDSQVVYIPRGGDRFEVRRSCADTDGRTREEAAEAVAVPGAPGSLQMRAVPRWRAWLPLGWKRRWVIAVAPDYQWAVVGAPDRDRLWIIARQPYMEPALLASLVRRAQDMGYPVDELVFAPNAGPGQDGAVPDDLVVSTNEPFWQARVGDGVLELTGPALQQPRRMQVGSRGAQEGRPGRYRILAQDPQGTVTLQVTVESCQDSMSGAVFPLTATLSLDGASPVPGCARPASMPPPGEMQ